MKDVKIVRERPGHNEQEMFTALATNLIFTGVENQVVVLTSSMAGEGKSTISFNLALSLSENDKKVLYVDADMRRSVFMGSCEYEEKGEVLGLSHYLSGQAEVNDVLYHTDIKYLYVIPAGRNPKTPAKLLANTRMDSLIESSKKVFDYIIIDTPPLGSVIDAAVLAKKADATMMVVSSNMVPRQMAKGVLEQLKVANANFLGVVLNKVDIEHHGYGGYYGKYYGRYYGKYYGHYGNENMEERK